MTFRPLSAAERPLAAYLVNAWGYWRDASEIVTSPCYTNGLGFLWFQPVPGDPEAWGLHWCAAPGCRPPADWVETVRYITRALGFKRVLVYIPAEEQTLHWRALRRYLFCRGFVHSLHGPVLEV